MFTNENGYTAQVIVLYADVRGSSVWTRRMSDAPDDRHDFWMHYDREMLRFKARTSAPFYKRLGDGRMFVWTVPSTATERALACLILCESLLLYSRVSRLIRAQRSPRPPGFRIRSMAGGASHEIYVDGEEDYLGYCANTCHKLLGVEPEIGVMTHAKIKEIVPLHYARRLRLAFDHLKFPKRCPPGVDREDMHELYTVRRRKR